MTDLEIVEAHLAKDLKDKRAGGEECDACLGKGYRNYWSANTPCPDCRGSGKSPAITQAEAALAAVRRERERIERLIETSKILPLDRLILLAEWFDLDDHLKCRAPLNIEVQKTLRKYAKARQKSLAEYDELELEQQNHE